MISRRFLRPNSRQAAWNIFGCLFAFVLLSYNFGVESNCLRFTNPTYNDFTERYLLLLPVLAVPWLFALPQRAKSLWVVLIVAPVAVILLLIFAMPSWQDPCQGRSSPIRSIPAGRSTVNVYQQCYADAYLNTVIQRESPILPGIVWVNVLCKQERTDDVNVTILKEHQVRFVFPEAGLRQHTDSVTFTIR